jgi:uncharacterized membrane protein
MRDVMLSAHFIGLAMTLGTSLAFMFLGIAASKMEKKEAQKFTLKTFALSKMGYIGITLLVLSGGYLMTPYWKILASTPLLITKLSLVLALIIELFVFHAFVVKAKKGETESNLKKTKTLGTIYLISTLVIVILAVSVFH